MTKENEKITNDTIKNGGVLAQLYFDIHAKTKENVEELGTGFIKVLGEKHGVVNAKGEINEPVHGGEGKNWSSVISVIILTRDFVTLARLCMAHSPFNAEILKPDEIKLQLNEVHELLGTIAATTAEYKKYILLNLTRPEDLASIQNDLKQRAEMGKAKLEKKGEKDGA